MSLACISYVSIVLGTEGVSQHGQKGAGGNFEAVHVDDGSREHSECCIQELKA